MSQQHESVAGLAAAALRRLQGARLESTRDALTCDGTNWYECCRSAN